jgi:hypothetical protein
MTKDDALRMMLGPFKAWRDVPGNEDVVEELTKIINAVEKVLAQPEQDSQDWKTPPKEDAPLVKWAKEQTTPPQRTWVGLTDDEKDHLIGLHIRVAQGAVDAWIEGLDDFIQAIEAKLKENT